MDRRPQRIGSTELDPLPEELTAFLRQQPWIADAVVRVREKGRELIAEAIVVPKGERPSVRDVARTAEEAKALDERLRHVGLSLAQAIPEELQRVRADQPETIG